MTVAQAVIAAARVRHMPGVAQAGTGRRFHVAVAESMGETAKVPGAVPDDFGFHKNPFRLARAKRPQGLGKAIWAKSRAPPVGR